MSLAESTLNCVLAPVDFSDVTSAVLSNAASVAAAFDTRIHLVHVVEPDVPVIAYEPGVMPMMQAEVIRSHEDELEQLVRLRTHLEGAGRKATCRQVHGNVIESILAEAKDQGAGLIVMGSHGHGAVYNLLVGSVAQGVLKKSACPVLIVPAGNA